MSTKRAPKKLAPGDGENTPTFPLAPTMPKRIKLPKRAISTKWDPAPKPSGELPKRPEV